MLVIAKFPQFQSVQMRYFPRFFAKQIQFVENGDIVDDHSSNDKRNVEFLGVMSAQNVLRLIEMIIQKVDKIIQNFLFFSKKRSHPEVSNIALDDEITNGNTDNFSELGPNSGSIVKILWRVFVFALVLGFEFPKRLHFIVQRIEIGYFRNGFDVEKQNVVEVDFFYHTDYFKHKFHEFVSLKKISQTFKVLNLVNFVIQQNLI